MVGQCPRLRGEHAMLRSTGVRAKHTQASHQHRHLGRSQGQQLRLVDEQRLIGHLVTSLEEVPEAVGAWFEEREARDVGLLLRRVRASSLERNRDVMTRVLRGLFDGDAARENNQVGQRHLLVLSLNAFKRLQHLREFCRLVDRPVLLRSETDARAVGAAATVGTAIARSRSPRGRDQLRHRETGGKNLRLECRDVLVVDDRTAGLGKRILPDQLFLRNLGAEVTRDRTHVAMSQLEPRARERIRELLRLLEEAARDLLVRRIDAQREVGGQHRRLLVRPSMRVGDDGLGVLRFPLSRTRGALRLHPLELEEVLEEVVAPLRRRRGPRHFEAARDRVAREAGAMAARPAESLFLDRRGPGIGALVRFWGGAVGLAEGVTTRDERHGFFVVHGHARERLADVFGRGQRIPAAVWTFGVHIDEAHLNRA